MKTKAFASLLGFCVLASVALAEEAPPATRTLDEITIEGAVDVPQVLFITSRDNVRFADDLGWLFLPTATEILAGVSLPAEIVSEEFPAFKIPNLNNPLIEPGEPAVAPEAKE